MACHVKGKVVAPSRVSQEVAAYAIGLSSRQLRNRKDAPRNRDGKYDLAAVVAWWVTEKLRDAQEEIAGNGVEKSPNLEALRGVKLEIAEMERDQLMGKLVSVDEVRTSIARAGDALKRRFLSMAGSIAPRLQGQGVEAAAQIIDIEVRDALDEFCEELSIEPQMELDEMGDDETDDGGPTEARRQ